MRHLSRACMLSIALSAASTVEAADLAPRPVPPAVAYNWSGFYVGGTVGWGWGNFNPHSSTVVDGYISSHTDVAAINATGSQNLTSNGLIGGIGAGFNWQAGNFVFGIEADAQAFRLAGTVINGGTFPTAPADTYVFTTSINSNWLLTVRPRIGWAMDNWLVYATGGLAVTDLSASFMWGDSTDGREAATYTVAKAGYVFGGGIETGLGRHWTLKAEYLYVRFNATSATGQVQGRPVQVFTHSADLHANIARVGGSYRF